MYTSVSRLLSYATAATEGSKTDHCVFIPVFLFMRMVAVTGANSPRLGQGGCIIEDMGLHEAMLVHY